MHMKCRKNSPCVFCGLALEGGFNSVFVERETSVAICCCCVETMKHLLDEHTRKMAARKVSRFLARVSASRRSLRSHRAVARGPMKCIRCTHAESAHDHGGKCTVGHDEHWARTGEGETCRCAGFKARKIRRRKTSARLNGE